MGGARQMAAERAKTAAVGTAEEVMSMWHVPKASCTVLREQANERACLRHAISVLAVVGRCNSNCAENFNSSDFGAHTRCGRVGKIADGDDVDEALR
jgi:hypothetical protein